MNQDQVQDEAPADEVADETQDSSLESPAAETQEASIDEGADTAGPDTENSGLAEIAGATEVTAEISDLSDADLSDGGAVTPPEASGLDTVRAKFKCNYVLDDGSQINASLDPVYSDDPEHENKKYWDATPCGSLQMTISNRNVENFFKLGREYYIDISEAPPSNT